MIHFKLVRSIACTALCLLGVDSVSADSMYVGSNVLINNIRFQPGFGPVSILSAYSADSAQIQNSGGEIGFAGAFPNLSYAKEAQLIRQYFGIGGSDDSVMMGPARHAWEVAVGYSPFWFSQHPEAWNGAVFNDERATISNAEASSFGGYDVSGVNRNAISLNNPASGRIVFVDGNVGGVFPNALTGWGDGFTQLYVSFGAGSYDFRVDYNLYAEGTGIEAGTDVDLKASVQGFLSVLSGNMSFVSLSSFDDELHVMQTGGADFREGKSGSFHFVVQVNGNAEGILAFGTRAEGSLSVAAVPEPETYAMLLAGLGLLGFAARRRKLKLAA